MPKFGKPGVVLAMAASAALMLGVAPGHAASPLGKTIDFTYTLCMPSVGKCLPPSHIHNYVSPNGHVFAFNSATGGRKSALGETFTAGNGAAQFVVEGDALVFQGAIQQDGNTLQVRVTVELEGTRCYPSGVASYNGEDLPVDIQTRSCRVYNGRKAY